MVTPPSGLPPKPSEAVSVGKGGAREREQFSPSAETERSGLCDDAAILLFRGGWMTYAGLGIFLLDLGLVWLLLRCPHCGKPVRELRPDKTCPYCGKKVE